MRLAKAIAAYVAHDDPLTRACNVIALVIAANQPLYPLYVFWLLDRVVVPTLLSFLSTPFFVAVPLLARRNSLWGRALLPLAGMANTVLVTGIFGQASGVELFLMPCMLIAAAFFRPSERLTAITLGAVGFGIFLGLDGRYGAPICECTAADPHALRGLHAMSAGALVVFIGLLSRDSRGSPPSP
jgi:hypothetical protein